MPRARDATRGDAIAGATAMSLGQSLTWLCGGALALQPPAGRSACSLLLACNGLGYFWQQRPRRARRSSDGTQRPRRGLRGARRSRPRRRRAPPTPPTASASRSATATSAALDFAGSTRATSPPRARPADAVLLERLEWGNFYGRMTRAAARRRGARQRARGGLDGASGPLHADRSASEREAIEDLEKGEIGDINYEIEQLRLDARRLELETCRRPSARAAAAEIERELAARAGRVREARRPALRSCARSSRPRRW